MQWDSLGMGFAHRGADAFYVISIFLSLEDLAPPSVVPRSQLGPFQSIQNTKNGESVNCQVLGEYTTSIAKSDDRIQSTITQSPQTGSFCRDYSRLIDWVILL